jgi:hypothetical protein
VSAGRGASTRWAATRSLGCWRRQNTAVLWLRWGQRIEAWTRLRKDLPMEKLEAMTVSATLADVPRLAAEILKGQIRGRVVVDVNR